MKQSIFITRKKDYNFKAVQIGELPKPHPPKYWKPTPAELERNPFLREAMPELVKEYGLDSKHI